MRLSKVQLFVVLLISFIMSSTVLAQTKKHEKEKPNIILIEIFGRGVVYSFNYNRDLNSDVTLGLGFSFYSISENTENVALYIIPIYANYYFLGETRMHRSFVTAGVDFVGGAISSTTPNNVSSSTGAAVIPVIGFGYEYRGDSGFVFRGGPYVFFGGGVQMWGGVSFGVAL